MSERDGSRSTSRNPSTASSRHTSTERRAHSRSRASSRHPSAERQAEAIEVVAEVHAAANPRAPVDTIESEVEAQTYQNVTDLIKSDRGQKMLHDVLVKGMKQMLDSEAAATDPGRPAAPAARLERGGETGHAPCPREADIRRAEPDDEPAYRPDPAGRGTRARYALEAPRPREADIRRAELDDESAYWPDLAGRDRRARYTLERDPHVPFSRATCSDSPTRHFLSGDHTNFWDSFYIQEDRSIQAIQAPTDFPSEDQIFGTSKIFLQKYKVTWEKPFQRRFNGTEDKKFGNPSVDYFLRRLNQCQRICPLSRREFKDALASNCEGAAWDAVEQWVRRRVGIQDIYNRLLMQFDHRPDPMTANVKLQTMDTSKFNNWAEVEDEVRNLAERASLAKRCSSEANRESLFDHLAISTLLRLMPSYIRLMAQVQGAEFTNMTGREMSFSMFTDFVNKFRLQLDDHLLQQKKKGKGKVQPVGPSQSSPSNKKGSKNDTQTDGQGKGGANNTKNAQPEKGKSGGQKQQQQVSGGRDGDGTGGRGTSDKKNAGRDFRAEAQNGRGYENRGRQDCPKCRDPSHNSYGCPYFEGAPAPTICKECHLEGKHYPADCPFARKKAAYAQRKDGASGRDNSKSNAKN